MPAAKPRLAGLTSASGLRHSAEQQIHAVACDKAGQKHGHAIVCQRQPGGDERGEPDQPQELAAARGSIGGRVEQRHPDHAGRRQDRLPGQLGVAAPVEIEGRHRADKADQQRGPERRARAAQQAQRQQVDQRNGERALELADDQQPARDWRAAEPVQPRDMAMEAIVIGEGFQRRIGLPRRKSPPWSTSSCAIIVW